MKLPDNHSTADQPAADAGEGPAAKTGD
jgi:hypothetical protein